jgi:outer membrane protein assembly factor BamC
MRPALTAARPAFHRVASLATTDISECPLVPFRQTRHLIAVAAAVAMAGCSSVENFLGGDKVDYRSQSSKVASLDVPPDLTQLARDSRYQPQAPVVSAAGLQSAAASGPTAGTPVAPNASANVRIERQGQQRWLVANQTPDQLWPQLRSFWVERGFNLVVDDPQTGVMETDWAENRGKIPMDLLRRTLGFLIESVYSTGERDKYRTRVERTPEGSEIYISHRGLEEFMQGQARDIPGWRFRDTDPQLEAEMLSRVMARLTGVKDEVARTQVVATPSAPAKARLLAGGAGAVLEFDETFDRAWRRVGLALDRSGFTVEDRDRASGLYFVRYVDPKLAGQEEPNFFSRLFSSGSAANAVQRYRVAVKTMGNKTQVSIQNSQGAPEAGDAGQRIASLLVDELK